jgi:hypothetical protein
MKQFLNHLVAYWTKWTKRRSARGPERRVRLALELLESRLVPTGLQFQGGPLLTNVEVTPVYFGSAWRNNPTYSSYGSQLNTFLNRIVKSPYIDQLREYSNFAANQIIGRGSTGKADWTSTDWNTHSSLINPAPFTTIDDNDITNMLKDEINFGNVPAPDANRLYVVYVAPNVAVTNGGQNSIQNFTGYHDVTTDYNNHAVYYAVIVDPSGYPGSLPKGSPSGMTTLQYDTITTSHELAEAITDPDANTGWRDYDPTSTTYNDEIGDLTQDIAPAGQATGFILDGYAAQAEWLNSRSANTLWGANFYKSGTTLEIDGDQDQANQNDTFIIDTTSAGGIQVTLNDVTVSYAKDAISFIDVYGRGGTNTFKINNSPAKVVIHSQGNYDAVTVGNGSLAGVTGSVDVIGSTRTTNLDVDDHLDRSARTITMDSTSIAVSAATTISWSGLSSVALDAGQGGNTIDVRNTFNGWTDVYTGTGTNTVKVSATSNVLDIHGQGGSDTVTVGSVSGLVSKLGGDLYVENSTGSTGLIIDDHKDATGRTATLNRGTLSWSNKYAPTIHWTSTSSGRGGVNYLDIKGGSGGNTFNVNDTIPQWTDLFDGSGHNRVNVKGTTGTLYIAGGAGDVVDVENNGSLAGIHGAVRVGTPGASTVYIDDSADKTGRTATLDQGHLTWTNYAAPVYWAPTAKGSSGLAFLGVYLGTGTNSVLVKNTDIAAQGTLVQSFGTTGLTVQGTTGSLRYDGTHNSTDTVVIGSQGSLSGIKGALDLYGSARMNVTVDDRADKTGRTATFGPRSLTWTNYAAALTLESAGSLGILGGSGGNTFTIQGVAANLAVQLAAGSGNDTIKMTGSLPAFAGALSIDGQKGTNTLDYSGYTSAVVVNLPLGKASAISGGVSNIQNVTLEGQRRAGR